MRISFSAPLLAVLLAVTGGYVLFSSSAKAGSTGMASIHTLKRQGNKLCMPGHFHYGADSSPRGRAQALKNAKRKWADFVIMEYGSDWGRFALARSKGIKCSGSSDGYYCSVSASPCKLLKSAVKKRKTAKRRLKRHSRKYRRKTSRAARRR